MYVVHYMPDAPGGQKELDSPEHELWMVVNHHVDARNWI